jgi:ethanolamine ammonia-lyase large subunit
MELKALLAKASPLRSGDQLAGIAAASAEERARAQMELADTPLTRFQNELLVDDEVTRLIIDTHSSERFAPIAHLSVGEFREWLLAASGDAISALSIMPEMAAAVSKIMRLQDLIAVAKKMSVVTKFRDTLGLPGRFSTRLQPNDPTDDPRGVAASIADGLSYASGDAVIGVNPASDDLRSVETLLHLLDKIRATLEIPTQTCVLAHVTTQMEAMRRGAPVDLVFQSIAGTEDANKSFGIDLTMLDEAWAMAKERHPGSNVMYFETGQGSALSANAHHGIDQQTCEARAWSRRSFLRQTDGPADGLRRLLYQPRRGRSGRYGCAAHASRSGGMQLHYGRAGSRRRDAALPEHVLPRCALRSRFIENAAGAGV